MCTQSELKISTAIMWRIHEPLIQKHHYFRIKSFINVQIWPEVVYVEHCIKYVIHMHFELWNWTEERKT